jgi:hypothetical protein
MTDKEFERIISFIVNENVVRRLLNSVDQSNKPNGHVGAHIKVDTLNNNLIKFLN